MTKRKRKPKRSPETPEQKLEQAQRYNLEFLEKWGQQMPGVNGVPICQALTYEMIQILNRLEVEANG